MFRNWSLNIGQCPVLNNTGTAFSILGYFSYEPASPETLLEAFRTLDPEQHGFLEKGYVSTLMTQDGEPFNQDELDEMLEMAIDPQTQTIPYEYYINQLMVSVPLVPSFPNIPNQPLPIT